MQLFRTAILFLMFITMGTQAAAKVLKLHFFGSRTCGECLEIKEKLIKPLTARNREILSIEIHDTDDPPSYTLMVEMEEKYKVRESSAQELFFPDTVLLGFRSIMERGEQLIGYYLEHPEKWAAEEVHGDTSKLAEYVRTKFSQFSFLGILAAGLVDGINPCAIATMIFLISFLATQKRRRSEILLIGLSFTAAVFLTYLLLGVGAFSAFTALKQYYWVSRAVRWTTVALAVMVGVLSYWDAFRFSRTRQTKDIKLQLPKAVKLRIHKVISGNLSGSRLVLGAVIAGFLVTLLEAFCTGQVYLPTIVLMTKQTGMRLAGWAYLVFYNFLFVLPLLIVMVLAYFGLRWDRLAKATQSNLPLLKISLGTVMIALAVFLAIAT